MKEDTVVHEKHTLNMQHKTMTERDQIKEVDSNHVGQHQDSTNLEEISAGKNDSKVSPDDCQKEACPQFTSISCSICSETFLEIRYLIEHLHLHEQQILSQNSERKTCKQPNLDVNQNTTKDKCLEKRKSEDHPIMNIGSKFKKFKTRPISSSQSWKKRFKCKICEKTFAYLSLLREHAETHTGETSYSGPKYGKDSQQKSNVKQRFVTHSNIISCPMCSKVLQNKACLTLHLRNHNKVKKGKQEVLEVNNQISNIQEYPDNTKNLVCEVNPAIFASEDVLKYARTPENRRANEKKIIRTYINTSNVERKALEDYPSTTNTFPHEGGQKIFVGEKPQTCDNYKTEFSEQSNLEIIPVNLQLHSNQRLLEKKIGSVSTTLSMHSGKHRFKCDLCDKSFNFRSNLKQHILSHKGERRFSCEKCGKTFKDKFFLKRHLPIHFEEKQHAYTKQKGLKEAGQNFDDEKMPEIDTQISNTEENISTVNVQRHSNNNYLCEVCGKNFNGRRGLANHRQRHFEEKRFKCNLCEKSFLRSSTLKNHLLLHSGEMPFSCEDCGVSFSHERDLTRHLTGISLIHLTGPCKTILEACIEEGSETAVSKKSSENDNQLSKVEEKTSLQHPPTKNTFSCLVCQKEFVGEKPTACDKCQTDLRDESCLDVTAISLPNESVEKYSSNACSDKVTFKCFFCSKSFSRINCLQVHVLCHSAEKVSCGLCGSIFKSSRNLAKHLHLHIGEKSHKCDLCGKSFRTKVYLEGHLRAHSDERPYLCEICGKGYKKKFDLVIHLQIHSNEECPQSVIKPFECEVCCKRFFTRRLLKNHRCEASSSQEPQGKDSCEVCGKEMSKGSLKRHLLSHSEDKPFKCEVCEKSYKTKYDLTSHLQNHSGEKPFSCEVCRKQFSSKRMLSNHRRYHSDPRSFACEFCPKTFGIKSTLVSHLRIHTGEKPFTCDVCQKSFRQSGSLQMHRRIHEGVKAFVCEQCSRGFYTSSDLKRHRRICSGEERPFVCEICQKSFRYGSHLTEHRRLHTGEKPFVCKVCNKSFRLCDSLHRHIRIHTGEKPYTCEVCQKGFIQQYNLKIHLRTHKRKTSVSSDLSNHANDPDAPTSSGLSDSTRGLNVPKSSKISDNSHVRDALSSNCPRDFERDASGVPHCTQSLDASIPSILQNQTHCLDGHTPSGLSDQQMSGQIPNFLHTQSAGQNWYY